MSNPQSETTDKGLWLVRGRAVKHHISNNNKDSIGISRGYRLYRDKLTDETVDQWRPLQFQRLPMLNCHHDGRHNGIAFKMAERVTSPTSKTGFVCIGVIMVRWMAYKHSNVAVTLNHKVVSFL